MFYKSFVEYRNKVGLRQIDIVDLDDIKNLSAFENGRSSNIKYPELYFRAAIKHGTYDVLTEIIFKNLGGEL